MQLDEEKMVFGIGTVLIMVVAWVLTAFIPSLLPSFTTLIGGLTGVYALFTGGHVSQKWVEGKTADGQPEAELESQDISMTSDDHSIADRASRA